MAQKTVREQVIELIEQYQRPRFTILDEMSLGGDLRFDSLDRVEFPMVFEDEFGLRFEAGHPIYESVTVADLVKYVEEGLAKKA